MSKIDKTDLENIKLITKEAKLSNISRIKIKKVIMRLSFLLSLQVL